MKRTLLSAAAVAALTIGLAACAPAADVVSDNISTAADNFEIDRKISFYNVITGETVLTIEGKCSLGNDDPIPYQRSVTCRLGPNSYYKHFIGLADNFTYFAEQIAGAPADPYRYRVIFRPSTLIPNIDVAPAVGVNPNLGG